MRNEIVALARQQAKAAARRAAVPAALGFIAAVFFLFAAAGLFAALFFWLERLYGPPLAALIIAGVAFVLGLITMALVALRRPKPAPPLPATLPQLAAILAQGAPPLSPRQTAVTAFILALALGLMARGPSSDKK
jgi:hypothetical protein